MKIDTPAGSVDVSNQALLIGGALLLLVTIGGLWYVKRKATQAAAAVSDAASTAAGYIAHDAVNVTSAKNVPNVVTNKVLQAFGVLGTNNLTGQPNTLGSATYEATQSVKGFLGIK